MQAQTMVINTANADNTWERLRHLTEMISRWEMLWRTAEILQNTALNALRGSVAFMKEDYYCI